MPKKLRKDSDFNLPGIFRIVCLPLKRAYFGDSFETRPSVRVLVDKLDLGICENKKLQEDYNFYGDSQFKLTYLILDIDFIDEIKRKAILE